MPKYHFQFDGEPADHGAEVRHFANADAARCEATKTIGAMISDSAHEPSAGREWGITVTDDKGLVLCWISAHSWAAPAMSVPAWPVGASTR